MACEPRCECPEGMVPSPANADLCVSQAEACSDMITTPSPPTTVAPTLVSTTAVPECPVGCVEQNQCDKPAPITCPPNEHWTECNYCTEMNCEWGMACARSCFVSRKTNVFVMKVMLVIHLVSKNLIGKVR